MKKSRKVLFGTLVFIGGVVGLAALQNTNIKLGGIPSGLLMLGFLYIFAKATGMNWFGKRTDNSSQKSVETGTKIKKLNGWQRIKIFLSVLNLYIKKNYLVLIIIFLLSFICYQEIHQTDLINYLCDDQSSF
jgi:hypothetical protein